jgi:HEAT repeat protein
MRINGISRVAPDPRTGEVRITMDAEHRVSLEGSLDDPRIQQVLLYAVKSYDNPGIRRESLDALRAGGDKPIVRQALLYTMQQDPNLGVRLAALDEVRGLEWGPDLQDAFLGVLTRDNNDGMRVAAVDILTGHTNASLLPALQRLAATDSCPYVRMKAAGAVRNLGR